MPQNPGTPLDALRRFVRPAPAAERCELCGVPLAAEHDHLVEPATRKLSCVCTACAILFSNQAAQKYRRVPRVVRFLPSFRLTDAQWDSLSLPIGLAFFLSSSTSGKVMAIYPSPAGPTESSLDLGSWQEIVQDNPILKEMEPDTEALLVNRVRTAREHYHVPIDECYRLVGLIRAHWRGLSGGTKVWEEIGRFFSTLKERSTGTGGAAHA